MFWFGVSIIYKYFCLDLFAVLKVLYTDCGDLPIFLRIPQNNGFRCPLISCLHPLAVVEGGPVLAVVNPLEMKISLLEACTNVCLREICVEVVIFYVHRALIFLVGMFLFLCFDAGDPSLDSPFLYGRGNRDQGE